MRLFKYYSIEIKFNKIFLVFIKPNNLQIKKLYDYSNTILYIADFKNNKEMILVNNFIKNMRTICQSDASH